MKPLEIKGARTRLGYTQQYMADRLDISLDTYRKKEKGVIKFADTEKVTVAKLLELTAQQVNDFFSTGSYRLVMLKMCLGNLISFYRRMTDWFVCLVTMVIISDWRARKNGSWSHESGRQCLV